MSLFRRGKVWWYEFWFAGRRIQESAKTTSKTLAKLAEQNRRRELEQGYNSIEDKRDERIRSVREVAQDYLEDYLLRNQGQTFAQYALSHVARLLGPKMIVDIDEDTVRQYQTDRLREDAAPKTINEEVGFLLRLLGDRGDLIRLRLRKQKSLKLKGSTPVAKAYSPEEKNRLVEAARSARSPMIYPALMLALNAGLRNAEIRGLRWRQVDLEKQFLTVGRSKTEAGQGRTIPLNTALLEALQQHADWYALRFERIEPDWFLFPFGRANHLDPTRPITTLKTAWTNARRRAGVTGRLHDSRHTLITELAETGAGDQTIMDIAGHVSRQMLKHYSHIRMKAKREALEAVHRQSKASDSTTPTAPKDARTCSEESGSTQRYEGASLQKSLHSAERQDKEQKGGRRKLLKGIGSSGRTRTYNPSVNSHLLAYWLRIAGRSASLWRT